MINIDNINTPLITSPWSHKIIDNILLKELKLSKTLYKPGEPEDALNSLLWFYEKIGQGRLNINIG